VQRNNNTPEDRLKIKNVAAKEIPHRRSTIFSQILPPDQPPAQTRLRGSLQLQKPVVQSKYLT
jgi:hypothetical protein